MRERARKERLYVVTGPVFKDVHGAIGKNEVTVPGYFYKLFYSPSRQQMVAYVVPNKASRQTLASFAVPVDKVERITGIDFFPGLPDELERIVEADTFSHVGDPYITALLDAVAGKESGGNPAEEKVRRPKSGDNRTAAADKTAGTSSDSRRYVPSAREQVILVLSVLLLFGMWRIFVYRGKRAGKKSRSRSRRSPSRSRRK